jgi:diguanylate cyclase (GGDEF)-like protein
VDAAVDPDDLQTRLAGLVWHAGIGVALFDSEDRLRYANPWFREAYSVDPALGPSWEQMMRGCHALRRGVLIETEDIDTWLATVRARYRSRPVRSFESDLADGRWVWVTETLRPDGWLVMSVADVSPLKASETAAQQARDEAVQVSLRDPLTELHNRRYIFQHLAELLAAARSMRWPLAVAMLDIDHFKRINDSEGHAAGDAVLRHFASLLRRQLRPKDAVGRVGGEEFLVVLPNASLDGAAMTLQRIRELISQSTTAARLPIPAYSFSAGLAAAQPDDTVDTLFRRVDDALYRAKSEGRNRDWSAESRSMRL